MAKIDYDISWGKLGPITINFKDAEIKKLLKSEGVSSVVEEVAKDMLPAIRAQNESEDWKVARHERPSRTTWMIYTDNIDNRWREVKTGKIAKWVRRNLIKGKPKGKN